MSAKTALTIHESFASNLAFGDNILWDAYTSKQFELFRQKLRQLFRDPEAEDGRANKAMEKRRQNIYRSTIAQAKYTNKNLLSTFILVTVAEGTTYNEARCATKFSVHLVVRTRKCIKEDDSSDCCMIFIDECGNVYQNWKHFIETNCLPSGIAFAPNNGVYTYNKDSLNMDAWATPASGLGSKILRGADYAAGIGGLGAAGVTLAAICTVPVSAPIMMGAAAVGLAVGGFTAVRSAMQLWNRSDHEQSISVTDSEARGCWLGVATGALALSSAAATKSLSNLALAGEEVSLIHKTVVNGMNISTMLISGSGVANGIIDLLLKYSDDEELSALEVTQLAASLVIFTHSVYNFRLASTIVSQAQDSSVNAYRSELSNRQRKMFDKMAKETMRTRGTAKGKIDIVRWINEVPDKQYLNDLHKVNKQLNKNNVRFAVGKDGNVVLNEDVSVKPTDLRSDVQLNQGGNVLKAVNNPIPESHAAISNPGITYDLTSIAFNNESSKLLEYCKSMLGIGSILILNPETFQNSVRFIIKKLGNDITKYLIEKARDFIQMYRIRVEKFLRTVLYIDTVLFDMYQKITLQLEDITIQNLELIMNDIFQALLKTYEKMTCDDVHAQSFECSVCGGIYRVTPI